MTMAGLDDQPEADESYLQPDPGKQNAYNSPGDTKSHP